MMICAAFHLGLLFLLPPALGFPQPHATATSAPTGTVNAAIAPGQIQVDPVEVPLPSSPPKIGVDTKYLTLEGTSTKWIGVDDWFTEPPLPGATDAPQKQGLKLSKGDNGQVEVALSKWFRDELISISKDVAKEISCALKLGARAGPADTECRRRQLTRITQRLGQNERLMQEIQRGGQQLARVANINAAEVASQGNAVAIGEPLEISEVMAAMGLHVDQDAVLLGGFGLSMAIIIWQGMNVVDAVVHKFEMPTPEIVPLTNFHAPDTEKPKSCPEKLEDMPECRLCDGSRDSQFKCTKEGDFKDCTCMPAPMSFARPEIIEEMFDVEQIIIDFNLQNLDEVPKDPTIQCGKREASGLPWTIFAGEKHTLTEQFCAEVEKNRMSKLRWIVDTEGHKLRTMSLRRRAPPVTPDTYKDYSVELGWSPKPLGCTKSCIDAYKFIAMGDCGHYGGQQNEMGVDGSWTDACGTYSWHVIRPQRAAKKTPLERGKAKCVTGPDPGNVDLKLENASVWACGRLDELSELRPGQSWNNSEYEGGKSMYKLSVEWPQDCVADGLAEQKVNPGQPLSPVEFSCWSDGWWNIRRDCWNDGYGLQGGINTVGGERDFGCVKYKFAM
ncbi:hypothetical protein CkaCkLH20_05224 [Colletotrichum karsti]|uniref:Uncharacterized protein n=1 Tax=Colletotrichum karsti TaxID=1095194 RepID=A0A9P6I7R6_9PEZI|nr:uncharacterized protein CkaCkLH20_05224 [Colletotrichum karsti]KAF9877524.1 hypothetical protein CkaCkLH20_05224 [Colletotrichum karsti]